MIPRMVASDTVGTMTNAKVAHLTFGDRHGAAACGLTPRRGWAVHCSVSETIPICSKCKAAVDAWAKRNGVTP